MINIIHLDGKKWRTKSEEPRSEEPRSEEPRSEEPRFLHIPPIDYGELLVLHKVLRKIFRNF